MAKQRGVHLGLLICTVAVLSGCASYNEKQRENATVAQRIHEEPVAVYEGPPLSLLMQTVNESAAETDALLPPSQTAYLARLRDKAKKGDANAQAELGDLYFDGRLVEQNIPLATQWYTLAAQRGNTYAQYELGILYHDGIGFEADEKKSNEWFLKADNANDSALAERMVGEHFMNRLGANYQPIEGIAWYERAGEGGDVQAQLRLGEIYLNGLDVQRDPFKALNWYGKAAASGDADAQYSLGLMFLNGEGVEKDPKTAVTWLEKAARQRLPMAQYNLAQMYQNGVGVPRDHIIAYAWLAALYAQQPMQSYKKDLKDWAEELSSADLQSAMLLSEQL